jgi:hypothetical protein
MVPSNLAGRFADFPSAGPYPNITGMKNLYWGKGAYCIRCGVYVYHVDRTTWEKY